MIVVVCQHCSITVVSFVVGMPVVSYGRSVVRKVAELRGIGCFGVMNRFAVNL